MSPVCRVNFLVSITDLELPIDDKQRFVFTTMNVRFYPIFWHNCYIHNSILVFRIFTISHYFPEIIGYPISFSSIRLRSSCCFLSAHYLNLILFSNWTNKLRYRIVSVCCYFPCTMAVNLLSPLMVSK